MNENKKKDIGDCSWRMRRVENGFIFGNFGNFLEFDDPINFLVDSSVVREFSKNEILVLSENSQIKNRFKIPLPEIEANRVVRFSINRKTEDVSSVGSEIHYCPLVSKMKNQIESIFFSQFYRVKYMLGHMSHDEAFVHFINHGIYKDYEPNPWFSNKYYRRRYSTMLDEIQIPLLSYLKYEPDNVVCPSSIFDPVFYAKKYPDIAEMPCKFSHYVQHGHSEGRLAVQREVPLAVKNEIENLALIEPLLSNFNTNSNDIVAYPKLDRYTYIPKLFLSKYGENIDAVVLVPYLSRGGADLVSAYTVQALQERLGVSKVLIIITEQDRVDIPFRLSNSTQIEFLRGDSSNAESVKLLHSILARLAPKKIVNCNSYVGWELFRQYGRILSPVVDLYAWLFCFDSDDRESLKGYITDYLPKTIGFLKYLLTDNKSVIEQIQTVYGFSSDCQSRIRCIYIPSFEGVTVQFSNIARKYQSYNRNILWIGRLVNQKRPDILVKIAAELPEYTFQVYGSVGNSESAHEIVSGIYKNINYMGQYDSINELDLSEYLLFLNTSAWDGLPNTLIQVMSAGLPIVTSKVGGIGELVNNETGWTVDICDCVESYVDCIKRMRIWNRKALDKAEVGMLRCSERHNWNNFCSSLERCNMFEIEDKYIGRELVGYDRRRNAENIPVVEKGKNFAIKSVGLPNAV